MEPEQPLDYGLVMLRGMVGRCPHCGKGKLFARYLKQVDACAACGESYAHINADDGPAWLTIVIVGHVLASVLLFVIPDSTWPDWLSMVVWLSVAVAMSLLLLPPAKGLFIGALWRMGQVRG
ncbi:MAG: DUF983 domain-containing protein [Pseudomonadota bacterium]